jgi:iron complex outermembrane receptor protein
MKPSRIALAIAMAFPVAAAAQSATLPTVQVTASPVIEGNAADAFGAFSTTVTDQQVQDLHAVDLASALRRTPGVTISRFNPVGAFGGEEGGAVYIRGMGSSRPGSEIKTYVDGIPFYMAVWNHPLLDLLPVNGMARIDVLKGPQPQHFGNTFGAINLVPRQAGSADGVSGELRLSAGSFGTVVEQADLTGRSGDWDYALAQGHARSDGHRADADGTLSNVMGRVGYRLNAQWSASLLVLHADNTARDPGHAVTLAGKGDAYNTRGTLAALGLAHDHGAVKGSVRLYANEGEAEQVPGLTSSFRMSGLRWREAMKPWAGGTMVAGLDVDRLSGSVSPVGFVSPRLTLTSPYAAFSHTLRLNGGWSLTPSAGVRWYRHTELGSASAPHAGLVLSSPEQLSIRANVSRGRHYPGLDTAVLSHLIAPLGSSWKTLQAESMNHREIGLTWLPRAGTTVDLSLFSDRVTGRYVFAFPPAVPAPTFLNLGAYTVRGSEVSLQHQIGAAWSLFVSYTHLASSKADLPYAPSDSLSLGVNWQAGPWRVGVDTQRQSSMAVLGQARADGSANTTRVDGFAVTNLRAAYRVPALGPRGEVFLVVENLFDRAYAFRAGYPMPGRSAQLGLRASF